MNRKIVAAIAVLVLSSGASARERVDIDAVAAQAGLTARQVRMVLGAPTAFAEYRTSYKVARDKLIEVLGREQVDELAQQYSEQAADDRAG